MDRTAGEKGEREEREEREETVEMEERSEKAETAETGETPAETIDEGEQAQAQGATIATKLVTGKHYFQNGGAWTHIESHWRSSFHFWIGERF